MRGLWYAMALACAAAGLAWQQGDGGAVIADPEAGRVIDGAYRNAYFDLAYTLPQDWVEGLGGPAPSASGYYVLGTLVPKGALTATMLIAAQDKFFAAKRVGSAAAMARDLDHAMAQIDGMIIDRAASEVTIADQAFARVDFSGVGLYRATFVTELRCHLLSFNLTSSDPARLAALTKSLDALAFGAAGATSPACVENYARGDNLLRRVEPAAAAPRFARVPVRIIIGADGAVTHVHVLHASDEQRKAIEAVLPQWRFKPYRVAGRPVAVETGLLFDFSEPSSQAID